METTVEHKEESFLKDQKNTSDVPLPPGITVPFRKSKSVCENSSLEAVTDPKSCRSISGYIENGQFSVCTTSRSSQDESILDGQQICSLFTMTANNDVSSLNNVFTFVDVVERDSVESTGVSLHNNKNNDRPITISIVVDKPEKVLATLDTFVTYRVVSQSYSGSFAKPEHQVRRRYSDFAWLRHRMEVKYPFCMIPALPEKHSVYSLDRFDPEFIKYRCMGLNLFMRWVAKCPQLSADPDLLAFLSLNDFDEWFSYRKTKLAPSTTCPDTSSTANLLFTNGGGASNLVPSILSPRCLSFSANGNSENGGGDGTRSSKNVDGIQRQSEYCSKLAQILYSLNKISIKLNKSEHDYVKDLESFHTVFNYWSEFEKSSLDAQKPLADCVTTTTAALKQFYDDFSAIVKNFEPNFIIPAQQFAMYIDVVRQVLKKRDQLSNEQKLAEENLHRKQNEYATFVKIAKLNSNTSNGNGTGTNTLNSNASGNTKRDSDSTKLSKLEQQLIEAKKKMDTCASALKHANSHVKSELDRWFELKDVELRYFLAKIARERFSMHQKCTEAWKNALDAASA